LSCVIGCCTVYCDEEEKRGCAPPQPPPPHTHQVSVVHECLLLRRTYQSRGLSLSLSVSRAG
jgi:hypothetical protein